MKTVYVQLKKKVALGGIFCCALHFSSCKTSNEASETKSPDGFRNLNPRGEGPSGRTDGNGSEHARWLSRSAPKGSSPSTSASQTEQAASSRKSYGNQKIFLESMRLGNHSGEYFLEASGEFTANGGIYLYYRGNYTNHKDNYYELYYTGDSKGRSQKTVGAYLPFMDRGSERYKVGHYHGKPYILVSHDGWHTKGLYVVTQTASTRVNEDAHLTDDFVQSHRKALGNPPLLKLTDSMFPEPPAEVLEEK